MEGFKCIPIFIVFMVMLGLSMTLWAVTCRVAVSPDQVRTETWMMADHVERTLAKRPRQLNQA